jgi:transposase-like protein
MTNTTKTTTDTTYNLDRLMEQHKTKSAVIRYLAGQGMSRGDIARFMGIRYQHVRNVLTQPLKKAD